MSLLVTAFGAFDGGPNCSERLLDRLRAERTEIEAIWGAPIAFARLPVDAVTAGAELDRAISAARPSHVLLMGQAAGRDAICLERIARNHRDLAVPDDAGRLGPLGPVRDGGPPEVGSTWPGLEAAATAMSAAGVPARVSDDAGSHLCNQTLYLAAEAGPRADPPFVATFLHLPLLPEQVAAGISAALRQACFALPLDDMARAVKAFLVHTRRSEASCDADPKR